MSRDLPAHRTLSHPLAPAASAGVRSSRLRTAAAWLPLVLALALFSVAGAYQLTLPGLHYDEAKEAGVNAMQLLMGQPVTAFRDATVTLGPWRIPLMVQDYIGNLNVLLAAPFLAVGGVNTVALRALPLVLAALTLFLTWKIAVRLAGPWAGAAAALLLAVNPSFVFWSRQGIFVTNITALFFMAALWCGLRWWEQRKSVQLVLTALACGFGVYAKLLFVWAAIALLLIGAGALAWERRTQRGAPGETRQRLPGLPILFAAALAFLLPLTPLILFNVRTGGTFASIFGNLGRSYYGVDNSAYGSNLLARLGQIGSLMRGDHLWYLGGVNANFAAPFLLLALVLIAALLWWLDRRRRSIGHYGRHAFAPALPLALLLLIVLQSAFTVSDLFITHFALVAPLIPLAGGLAFGAGLRWSKAALGRSAGVAVVALALLVGAWVWTDAGAVVRYHRDLTVSGGFAGHSDAIYRLADYLDSQGYTAPVVLDWGIDAPVRFLTAGRVQPVEVFGYDRLDAPDAAFMDRLASYLADWQTIYVAHAPGKAVFQGRVEAMAARAAEVNFRWLEQIRFAQRSGEWMFIVHRFLQ